MTPARPLIVALFGGPGTGKSTTASLVFGALKQRGHNVELVHEVAKDLTWEGRYAALGHQPYVIAKQMFRYDRLNGQVDAIITDTSTLLAHLYIDQSSFPDTLAARSFLRWVTEDWRARRTLNIRLGRDPSRPYNPAGRTQTEAQANALDLRTSMLLRDLYIPHRCVTVNKDTNEHVEEIVRAVECLQH